LILPTLPLEESIFFKKVKSPSGILTHSD